MYVNAPVSEVVLGIVFSINKFSTDDIFAMSGMFKNQFPFLSLLPPLVVEDLKGYKLIANIDHSISGPMLLRRFSKDNRWLLQIQSNALYLNWIRPDYEPVGNYVGYNSIFNDFLTILKTIESKTLIKIDEDVHLFELTYNDRIDWQNYISDLSQISELMTISTPPIFSSKGYNNIFSQYIFENPDLNGYGTINISTATTIEEKQILKVETSLRGGSLNFELNDWFNKAHIQQLDIFEKIFTSKIKEYWL